VFVVHYNYYPCFHYENVMFSFLLWYNWFMSLTFFYHFFLADHMTLHKLSAGQAAGWALRLVCWLACGYEVPLGMGENMASLHSFWINFELCDVFCCHRMTECYIYSVIRSIMLTKFVYASIFSSLLSPCAYTAQHLDILNKVTHWYK